jgi:hypothetical protein
MGQACPENVKPALMLRSLNTGRSICPRGNEEQSGDPYPPNTVSCVLAGLLRYMRHVHGQCLIL